MVVLGHCIQFGSGPDMIVNKSYFDDTVFRFIYSFHMPAFALVSGYFFKRSAGQKAGIGKKAKTLLVPVMVWSFLVAAVLLIKSSLQGGDILDNITDFSRIILTYLWFLRASFVSFVLIWLVKRFCKDSILIHILILTVSLFIPDWLNTELWKFTYPFFVAGYYWNVCNMNERLSRLIKHKITVILILLGIFASLFAFYDSQTFVYTSGTYITGIGQVWTDIQRFMTGLAGSSLIIMIMYTVYGSLPKVIGRLLAGLGRISMTVYILDVIFTDYFLPGLTLGFNLNYLISAAQTAVLLVLFYGCDRIIRRFPASRALLLGGR